MSLSKLRASNATAIPKPTLKFLSQNHRDKKGQPQRTAQKLCYRGYLIYAIAATGIRKCGYSGNDSQRVATR